MIKRPLHAQFGPKVLADIKRTTIRETSWPVRKPIMLYHWSGRPYNSPHHNVAAVEVLRTSSIEIAQMPTGAMVYALEIPLSSLHDDTHPLATPLSNLSLWQLEGFDSQAAMDAWFRPLVKPGHTLQRHLMLFKRL